MEADNSKSSTFRAKWNPIYQRTLKRKSLIKWRETFEFQMDLKSRISAFRIKRDLQQMSLSYVHWKDITAKSTYQRQVIAQCTKQLIQYQISHFIANWKYAVFQRKRALEIEVIITNKLHRNKMLNALKLWETTVMANNARFDWLKGCYLRIRTQRTLRYFMIWKSAQIQHSEYIQFVSQREQNSMRFHLRKWMDYYRYLVQQREIEDSLREKHERIMVTEALSVWGLSFLNVISHRKAQHILCQIQVRYRLTLALDKWREYTKYQLIERKSDEIYREKIYRKVLDQWNHFMSVRATEKREREVMSPRNVST